MPCAYYNELDPKAAAWLRELIRAGHIAPGEVDERSIVDVRPSDLAGFTQCHFFAGIAVWSHALRSAGWPDTRAVWTGSCPCQSFSAAGSGRGFDDERHLWPHFFRLIREQRPGTVFGEQVASKDGLAWLDFVCADMESEGYAIAPLDLCAAGFGAPHIRQRLFFVADANGWHAGAEREQRGWEQRLLEEGSGISRLAHAPSAGADGGQRIEEGSRNARGAESAGCGELCVVGDSERIGSQGRTAPDLQRAGGGQERRAAGSASGLPGSLGNTLRTERWSETERRLYEFNGQDTGREEAPSGQRLPGPANGFWRDAEWLACTDGKARPVEPGTFPLVAGIAKGVVRGGDSGASFDANSTPEARVMRLRGYGNSIVGPVGTEFIRAFLEIKNETVR